MNERLMHFLGFACNAFIAFLLTFVDFARLRIDPEHSTIAEYLYLDGRDAVLSFLILLIPARDLGKFTGKCLHRFYLQVGRILKYIRPKV